MNLETSRLDGPFGAEVHGLDLTRPETIDATSIHAALAEHALLLFRRQFLDDGDLVRLLGRLGSVQPPLNERVVREYAEINYISNLRDERSRPIGGLGSDEVRWHSDNYYREQPDSISLILAVLPAPRGGDTDWIHIGRAHATLPAELRERIAGRRGVYALPDARSRWRRWLGRRPGTIAQPLEIAHPRRGDTALYVSHRTLRIEGLPPAESTELIDALLEHVIRPEAQVRHAWRPGDLVLYDNLQTIHHREPFEGPRLVKGARFEIA